MCELVEDKGCWGQWQTRPAYTDLWHAQHSCAAAAAQGCSGVEYDGSGRYVLMWGGSGSGSAATHFGHAAYQVAGSSRRRAQDDDRADASDEQTMPPTRSASLWSSRHEELERAGSPTDALLDIYRV